MTETVLPKAVAELIGAFTLVFVGVLASANGASLIGVGFANGLAIAVMVAAMGHVSGGHFNPAVTFAFWLSRRINGVQAGVYWAAQLFGGLLAALIVAGLLSRNAVGAGTPQLAEDINVMSGIVAEAVATFFLVLVIFGTVLDRRAPASVYPLAIGLTITAGVLAIGPLTGAALNPARGFGPALVSGEWGALGAWLIGPLLGGALAWAVYEYVLAPGPEVTQEV
jgi:MIP family channel proteins